MQTHFNPYEVLKELDISLYFKKLPEGLNGLYIAKSNLRLIILSKGLNQAERRCVLTEELAHYFLGHTDNILSDKDYRAILSYEKFDYDAKIWAADRLIDTNKLIKLMKQDHQFTPHEIADMFWVDLDILFFKMQRLVNLGYISNFFVPDIM